MADHSLRTGGFGGKALFFTDYEKEPPPTVDRAWVLPPIAIYPYMPLNTNFRKNLKQSCDQIWAKMGHFWAILGDPDFDMFLAIIYVGILDIQFLGC